MSQVPRNDSRLPALDLLRFMAALAVTLYHYVSCYPLPADEAQPAVAAISAVTRYGYLGVDLFFMISGFVILWSSIHRDGLSFAIGRISRLYPSFWVSLALTILCIYLFADATPRVEVPQLDARTILANMTMVPAVFDAPLIEGVYWTLEIEIRFYALIFLLLLFRQMPHVEMYLHGWLALSIVALFVPMPWVIDYLCIKPYGAFFVAGALFYLVYSRGVTASRIVGLAISAVACAYISIGQRGGFITADTLSAIVVPCLIVIFFATFAMLAVRKDRLPVPGFAYALGALTYPLYLTHAMMGYITYEMLRPRLGLGLTLFVITVLALVMAWIITATVDIPARKPLANLLYRCARTVGLFKASPRASLP